jgi:hypothetical protein
MATELCKYIINKGTDALFWLDGGVVFGYMILVSPKLNPYLKAQNARRLLEDFIFLSYRVTGRDFRITGICAHLYSFGKQKFERRGKACGKGFSILHTDL